MPHSIFTGRVQEPGEPYFLREDTDLAVALAEEERDACPSCGYPKAWCRDPANQVGGVFEVSEEHCQATYVVAARADAMSEQRDAPTRAAVQSAARFKEGHRPNFKAGLDLPESAAE